MDINKKRYGITANILNIILTESLSLLVTYFGKLSTNPIAYLVIAVIGLTIMILETFIIKTILSDKKLKDLIVKKEKK